MKLRLDGVTILLVDDEPGVLRFAGDVLQKYGAKVHTCPGGLEAQNLAGRVEQLDLVITDVILPDITGVELVRVLRAWHPGIRALAMSGLLSDDEDAFDGTPFLQKPFTPATLLERVKHVLTPQAE